MTKQSHFAFDSLRTEVEAIGGLIPRDYQQSAIEESFRLWQSGTVGVLVRSPTGSGKTVTGTMIGEKWLAQGKDYRVLVIAHERQLVHQFAQEIQDITGKSPGIEMSKEHVKANRIPPWTVACRQSLISKTDPEGDFQRFHKFDNLRYKWLVIPDEVHRWAYKLKSCGPLLEWFNMNPDSRRLGLTATPKRGDGTSLAKVCPGVASDYKHWDIDGGHNAVDDGWAVPYEHVFVVAGDVDFKNLREIKSTGDFDPAQLEELLATETMLRKLCEPTLNIVGDRRTIVFSATTEMAKAVARTFNGYRPDCAVELDGLHKEFYRADVYKRHQSGAFQILSVCGLCREGYNDPGIGAVAIFRPSKSETLVEQMIGRGCRPLRGCVGSHMTREERLVAIAESTKPNCIIVDLIGCTGLAGCVSAAHIMARGQPDSLIHRLIRNKNGSPQDIGEGLRKARRELDDEERERRRQARERREQQEREEAARRGRIKSEVRYTATRVKPGHGARNFRQRNGKRGSVMIFGKHKGKPFSEIPGGYLRAIVEGDWCKTEWIKHVAKSELSRRSGTRDSRPAIVVGKTGEAKSVDEINAMLAGF